MKALKKIIGGLLAMMAVSFAFAQQKENLDDYLDEINSLIQEGIALDADYRAKSDAAVKQLQSEAQDQINEASLQEAFPWENPYEHSKRVNDQVIAIQEQLKKDIEQKSKELTSAYKAAKAELDGKRTQLWNEIAQLKLKVDSDKIEILCGAFDTYEKYWPLVVRTVQSQLEYSSGELKIEPNMNEIETEYYKFQKLIDENKITAEINVRIQQKDPTACTYEICLVDVTLYDDGGEVLYSFPGYSQVIQVVDYMKENYDPTAEPPEVTGDYDNADKKKDDASAEKAKDGNTETSTSTEGSTSSASGQGSVETTLQVSR